MREVCSALQGFEDQCVSYVELYGPLLLNVVAQYLKPELCNRMGYCPAPGLPHAQYKNEHQLWRAALS